MNFEIDNTLPKMPDEFLLSGEHIRSLRCLSPQKAFEAGYASYLPDNETELTDYLFKYFNTDIEVRYQLITNDLPMHQDICEQDYKFNYVYETGGDNVLTQWEGEEIVCEPYTWYRLNVRNYHAVSNVVSDRLSITVKIKE